MVTVWMEGIDELNTISVQLIRAGGAVGATTAAVVRRSAHQVEALGKRNAPVDTGNLRSSIGVDFIGDGRTGSMEAVIGPTAAYAPHVEWGTTRMAPHAFMGPALDRVGPDYVAGLMAASVIDGLG